MTDQLIVSAAIGWIAGTLLGALVDPGKIRFQLHRLRQRRRPYSSAAIAFRATAEDAANVRSKIVNPLAWEDPPEQFIRMDEGRVQRGNGKGGPTTPKPEIAPKPQYPGGYISLDGAQPFRVRGRLQPLPDELDAYTYQRGPQGDTPNPPPSDP